MALLSQVIISDNFYRIGKKMIDGLLRRWWKILKSGTS